MTPEQLVPSLELCQRAQRLGWKRETHFVWMQFPTYLDGMPTGRYVYHVEQHSSHPMYPIIPAHTLQEVLEELPEYTSVYKNGSVYEVYESGSHKDFSFWHNDNPAHAALELWCELEERKQQL